MATIIARPSSSPQWSSATRSPLSSGTRPWSTRPDPRSGGLGVLPRTTCKGQRTRGSSAHALAMLARQPVFMASLPRFHVVPRGIDGTLLVVDRASDEQFAVYTPRFTPQFRAGHLYGHWYLRPMDEVGPAPRSPAFRTAKEAVDAICARRRGPSTSPVEPRHARIRVIWS
jgi:hypothetical protein